MGIPKGYKLKEETRNNVFQVRLSDNENDKLISVANETGMSKAEVIRNGIEIQHKEIYGGVVNGDEGK